MKYLFASDVDIFEIGFMVLAVALLLSLN